MSRVHVDEAAEERDDGRYRGLRLHVGPPVARFTVRVSRCR